jgi:hypothetical protein
MASSRFTPLEIVFAVLVGVGGVTTLAADRLGNEPAKNVGIMVVFLGAIVFGLSMIVQRRADIATRYSSSINPAFHVFRGPGAIAWGLAFVLAGVLFVGAGLLSLTGETTPKAFLDEHPGPFVILGGLLVTAWGLGSASPATYRYRETERPAHRFTDRLAAIVLILPAGVVILGWGLLMTFAPTFAAGVASAAKATARQWIETLIKNTL